MIRTFDFSDMVLCFLAGTLFGVIISGIITYNIVTNRWEREALSHMAANYIPAPNGPIFKWKN